MDAKKNATIIPAAAIEHGAQGTFVYAREGRTRPSKLRPVDRRRHAGTISPRSTAGFPPASRLSPMDRTGCARDRGGCPAGHTPAAACASAAPDGGAAAPGNAPGRRRNGGQARAMRLRANRLAAGRGPAILAAGPKANGQGTGSRGIARTASAGKKNGGGTKAAR